ncbi:hypothetical protein J6590_034954 [Homalodisca vitripennis]|nr:hypothetical protein J6590_034954 [Homalodisca vitripennis]
MFQAALQTADLRSSFDMSSNNSPRLIKSHLLLEQALVSKLKTLLLFVTKVFRVFFPLTVNDRFKCNAVKEAIQDEVERTVERLVRISGLSFTPSPLTQTLS